MKLNPPKRSKNKYISFWCQTYYLHIYWVFSGLHSFTVSTLWAGSVIESLCLSVSPSVAVSVLLLALRYHDRFQAPPSLLTLCKYFRFVCTFSVFLLNFFCTLFLYLKFWLCKNNSIRNIWSGCNAQTWKLRFAVGRRLRLKAWLGLLF